jgi:hypothetical protein
VVRAVATTRATGSGSSINSAGTTFANLRVNGQSLVNVSPNTKVGLPKALFGKDSYVALREEVGNTSGPSAGQLSGGTYAANLEINMIRVHITDLLPLIPGKQATEIIVGHAKAHSDFPQTRLCEGRAKQSVSGHAYVAAAQTDPDLLPALVGYSYIPSSGGDMSTSAASVQVPGPPAANAGSIVSAAAVDARSQGTLASGASQAASHAQVADLCVLRAVTGLCTVGATAVRSQASSTAVAGSAASTDSAPPPGTQLVGLQIAGVPGPILAPRNSVVPLPGLGYLALNQQFCDGIGTPPTCAGGAHTGLTVRQVVLVVTVPNPLGLKLGAQVVVAEAHSDATYIP